MGTITIADVNGVDLTNPQIAINQIAERLGGDAPGQAVAQADIMLD